MTVPDVKEDIGPILNKKLYDVAERGSGIASFATLMADGTLIHEEIDGPCHASLKYVRGARYVVDANPNADAYPDYVHYVVFDSPYRSCFRPDLQPFDEMMEHGWILDGANVTARLLTGACIALRMVNEFKSICVWFEKHTKRGDSAEFKNVAFLLAHMLGSSKTIDTMGNSSHQAIPKDIKLRPAKQFVLFGEPASNLPLFTENSNYQQDGFRSIFSTWGNTGDGIIYGRDIVLANGERCDPKWDKFGDWQTSYNADFSLLSVEQIRDLIASEVERLRIIDTAAYKSPPLPPAPPEEGRDDFGRPFWLNWAARDIGANVVRDEYDRIFGAGMSRVRHDRFEGCLDDIRTHYRQRGL